MAKIKVITTPKAGNLHHSNIDGRGAKWFWKTVSQKIKCNHHMTQQQLSLGIFSQGNKNLHSHKNSLYGCSQQLHSQQLKTGNNPDAFLWVSAKKHWHIHTTGCYSIMRKYKENCKRPKAYFFAKFLKKKKICFRLQMICF